MKRNVIAAVLCSALAACSSNQTTSGDGEHADDPATEIPLGALDEQMAAAYCDRLFPTDGPACCEAQRSSIFPEGLFPFTNAEGKEIKAPTDHDSCLIALRATIRPSQTLQKSLDEKRITYDAKAALACINEIRSVTCEELSQDVKNPGFGFTLFPVDTFPSFCPQVVAPAAEASGVKCLNDFECTGGKFCHTVSGNTQEPQSDGSVVVVVSREPGDCEAPPAQGQNCDNGAGRCADGLTCDFLGDGEPTCKPAAADGTSCFSHDECINDCITSGITDTGICGAAEGSFCGSGSAVPRAECPARVVQAAGTRACLDADTRQPAVEGCCDVLATCPESIRFNAGAQRCTDAKTGKFIKTSCCLNAVEQAN